MNGEKKSSMITSELKSGFRANEVLVVTQRPIQFLAALEGIFRLDDQLTAEAVAQAETQTPQIRGQRVEEICAEITVPDNRETFVRGNDLAEPRGGVKFMGQILRSLDRVIKNIPPVVGGGVIVVVTGITAERPHMAAGPVGGNI